MKIVHLGKYYPPAPGGIETHVRVLARAQADLGLDVRVFCMNHRHGKTTTEMDGQIEVTRFGRAVSAAKLDWCPDLIDALKNVEADLLHVQVPNPTMILACLIARPKPPMVVMYQSDLVKQRLRGILFRPLERRFYRHVPLILQSSPLYSGGSAFLKPYHDRLDVLPIGIDLEPYLNPTAEHRAEADRLRALHPGPLWLGCGRMIYYKGFSNAIRALPNVPGTLVLVGGGPLVDGLKDLARQLGVADRVVFAGNLPHYLDIIPYYLAAEAFWFPSNARSEAFGIVQVEAMAAGCPVINTAIPHSGVPWVSRNEQEGLTVPMDDPAALAAAARRLLDEPGLRSRLVAAAHERVVSEFDHRVMADRSLAFYRRLLENSPVPLPAGQPARAPGMG